MTLPLGGIFVEQWLDGGGKMWSGVHLSRDDVGSRQHGATDRCRMCHHELIQSRATILCRGGIDGWSSEWLPPLVCQPGDELVEIDGGDF
jgi:hypothetical protein